MARLLALTLCLAGCHQATVSSSHEAFTDADAQAVLAATRTRVKVDGPNDAHQRRLFFYAPPFANAAGADLGVVQAAAMMHDATKEDGAGTPKERFCNHGNEGGAWAEQTLLTLGKSATFASRVRAAITEHMGPCGENPEWHAPRFMTKFCAREFPAPSTLEAKVLFDLDMLDLMTVDGVVKVVQLRQRGAEFEREPLRDSAETGADSAWKSVNDARQVLFTTKAQQCGAELTAHTRAFLDAVPWAEVSSVEPFKAYAVQWLQQHPLPECLPRAPSAR